jgi:CDP-4-dehydro-6-deoxyglucose reductase
MKPGDLVAMKGPLGTFGWREPVRESVLVATGTGIAPFRGMLADYFARGGDAPVTLIFGARYEEGLLFAAEFREWAARHGNFRFLPTLTRPEAEWTGYAGRVQPLMLEAIRERRDLDVYLCGLKAMVEESRNLLKELGFDRKQIIAEKYD